MKYILFSTCYLISFSTSCLFADQPPKFEKSPAPTWVKECEFPLEPVPIKPSQVNVQHLLTDTQRNIEEKILYWHFVTKALTQTGVDQIAQFNVSFSPSYQKLVIHKIRIFRDGEWQDRLDNTRLELLQREENLENKLIEGDLTLAHFLEDIREGDIVDYACSFVGEHPLFATKCSTHIKLQEETTTEKISNRILSHPDHPIFFKAFNTTVEPKIEDISPHLRAWTWEAFSNPPSPFESGQPNWHYPHARVQISQYRDWKEVAEIIAPLFALPEDFNNQASSKIIGLVDKWKKASHDPAQQALLALRFVQDEIRYLGFEEGIGAFKPADPNQIFQRRFGDCKDKAFLLHALLHLMNISSKPVLVHAGNNAMLIEALPTPWAFNHVILQINIGNRVFYCDPTQTLQGGTLPDNSLPDYKWGLILSKDAKELINLPILPTLVPSKIDVSYTFNSPDIAELTIVTQHYGSFADYYRKFYRTFGSEKVSERFLTDIRQKYPNAVQGIPLEFKDDRLDNHVSFIEKYKIFTTDNAGSKVLSLLNIILESYFDWQINLERSTPYALTFPYWFQEHIHVENPYNNWAPISEKFTHNHESFQFSQHVVGGGTKLDIRSELKHLKDHVPVSAIHNYWDTLKEMENKALWQITVNQPQTTAPHPQPLSWAFLMAYLAIGSLTIGIRYYFYHKNQKLGQI